MDPNLSKLHAVIGDGDAFERAKREYEAWAASVHAQIVEHESSRQRDAVMSRFRQRVREVAEQEASQSGGSVSVDDLLKLTPSFGSQSSGGEPATAQPSKKRPRSPPSSGNRLHDSVKRAMHDPNVTVLPYKVDNPDGYWGKDQIVDYFRNRNVYNILDFCEIEERDNGNFRAWLNGVEKTKGFDMSKVDRIMRVVALFERADPILNVKQK